MRAMLNLAIPLVLMLTLLATPVLAHPGHEGHGFPAGSEPIAWSNILLAIIGASALMGVGMVAKSIWSRWRSSN